MTLKIGNAWWNQKVASCKNLKDVKHLKLDIENEITEKYKNLYNFYLSKIDKMDESSKLSFITI
jgi:hypothetical protein